MSERRLHLLRHAKSSWDDLSLADEERPLAPRGKAAVQVLCRHFRETGVRADLVLCSPSRRTRETWAGVREGVGGDPEVVVEPDVYEATLHDLVRLLHGIDAGVGTALVVGHNPGTAELLDYLLGMGVAGPVPTGTFATVGLDVAWERITAGTGTLIDIVRPRELA